ncbi:MAG: glycoside hydrolase family 65 protein [Candidatus Bipolaricaulia bacterium]
MKTHSIEAYDPSYPPAYLANGLVGLRLGQIPFLNGSALVNGFVHHRLDDRYEQYAPAPFPIGADLLIDRTWLQRAPDHAVFQEQHYDFSCGELVSRFDFSVDGVTAHVEVLTFCSRTLPSLVLQEIIVSVDEPCNLGFRAGIEMADLPGRSLDRRLIHKPLGDAILLWEGNGGLTTVGAAFFATFEGEDAVEVERYDWPYSYDSSCNLCKEYRLEAQPGKRYRMRQWGSLVPGIMHSEPHFQAVRAMNAGRWRGFDALRDENRAAWEELWQGRVQILGAKERWQEIADAAYFYLHSSAHPAMPLSVAPFGLSHTELYNGHVFWDTETFIFPPALLTAPDAARAMLEYRSRDLQAARYNAALLGYRGIQFPWETCLYGDEVTPMWASVGWGEHHVNLDVAFAFAQYVHATGDERFLRDHAWPVLEGVAEWIVSRVTQTKRGYEIRHVTGIDEGITNIHNNAYTNIASIVVLREAIEFAQRMGVQPPATWVDVEQNMFLPIDPKLNIILKHDAYKYKGGICTPETLAGFFPLIYRHPDQEIEKNTYQYHMDLADTYLGYPMLSAVYGVWATRMGRRKLALEFFEKGIADYILEPFMGFGEFSSRPQPMFLTNPAGFLLALYFGLTGLELDAGPPEDWFKRPIVMPEGWDGIEVERIWARGRPVHLVARHGDQQATMSFTD